MRARIPLCLLVFSGRLHYRSVEDTWLLPTAPLWCSLDRAFHVRLSRRRALARRPRHDPSPSALLDCATTLSLIQGQGARPISDIATDYSHFVLDGLQPHRQRSLGTTHKATVSLPPVRGWWRLRRCSTPPPAAARGQCRRRCRCWAPCPLPSC